MFDENKRNTVCYRVRENSKSNKRTRHASVSPPPYETASVGINKIKKHKIVNNDNECNCKKGDYRKSNSWRSIEKDYGNKNTTVVYNNENIQPIATYKDNAIVEGKHKKKWFSFKHKPRGSYIVNPMKNDNKQRNKSRSTEARHTIQVSEKKTITNDRDHTRIVDDNGRLHGTQIKLQKLPHNVTFLDNGNNKQIISCQQKGILCPPECYELVKLAENEKYRNTKHDCLCKLKKTYTGEGDQIQKTATRPFYEEKVQSLKTKEKISRKKKHDRKLSKRGSRLISIIKRKDHPKTEEQPERPMFAIKVNSENFQILNPTEIEKNVKAFGRVEKQNKCICPSRLERLKKYGLGDTCEAGICQDAHNDKYRQFDCKCKKKGILECSDSTCDDGYLKRKLLKDYRRNPINEYIGRKKNGPLFEMILDKNNMNILNTNEIDDVLHKASKSKVCPTGICSKIDDKHTILNCRCLSKKIVPGLHECNENTCRPKVSRFKMLYSRIFSKSECWLCNKDFNRPRKHYFRRQSYDIAPKGIAQKRDRIINADRPINTAQKGRRKQLQLTQDIKADRYLPRYIDKHGDVKCLCDTSYCECNQEIEKQIIKKFKKKTPKNIKKIDKTKGVLETQKHYEKRLAKAKVQEEKEALQEEKEKLKRKKELKKLAELGQYNSNCFSNIISGLYNVITNGIQQIVRAFFYILRHPQRSFSYISRRLDSPMETIRKIRRWFGRTWKNKESKLSQALMDSDVINVLADHMENSAVFQFFSPKGHTLAEKAFNDKKSMLRKKRMRRRHDAAVFGCRHILLTTLRKHPCIWIYHVCPSCYPQCLGLMQYVGNVLQMFMFLLALVCWTPCIVACEIVRALFCCVGCTN